MIGSETIDKALCDLGASVSFLPLSLFKRIGIGELKPTEMTLKLADRSTIQVVGFVEDIEGIWERFFKILILFAEEIPLKTDLD